MNTLDISDFIDSQRRFKELLISLYTYKDQSGIPFSDAVDYCGGDEGELDVFVRRKRMGVETGGNIVLDPTLKEMYEMVLHAGTYINADAVGFVGDVEAICTQWEQAENARDKAYLINELYRILDRIPYSLEQSLSDISRITEEEYKSAISFSLKKAKLTAILEKVKKVQSLINEGYDLLSNRNHKLRILVLRDPEVDSSLVSHVIILALKQISLSSEALVEITRRLQVYITKIERASRMVRRIRLVAKKIRDSKLESDTNFLERVQEYGQPVAVRKGTYFYGRYDLRELVESGKYNSLLLRIQSGDVSGKKSIVIPPPIDFAEHDKFIKEAAKPFVPKYKAIFRAFLAQGKDLFSFLIDYDYGVEVPMEKKISLFDFFLSTPSYGDRLEVQPSAFETVRYTSSRTGTRFVFKYPIIRQR